MPILLPASLAELPADPGGYETSHGGKLSMETVRIPALGWEGSHEPPGLGPKSAFIPASLRPLSSLFCGSGFSSSETL